MRAACVPWECLWAGRLREVGVHQSNQETRPLFTLEATRSAWWRAELCCKREFANGNGNEVQFRLSCCRILLIKDTFGGHGELTLLSSLINCRRDDWQSQSNVSKLTSLSSCLKLNLCYSFTSSDVMCVDDLATCF